VSLFSKKPALADPCTCVRDWDSVRAQKGWWHSFELPDGRTIEGVNDVPGLKNRIGQFPIPSDLSGKRVLDIGAWDGWFSFEMERRGAEVVAVDCWDNDRFRYIHHELHSRVDYRVLDLYELDPNVIGRFDIVLFLGVLYHLKHPLLALEKVCALTTDLAAVDSYVVTESLTRKGRKEGAPVMEFYEVDEFGGQFDNWVGPNVECLVAFCRTAGFARVELRNVLRHSACVACHRKWEPPPAKPEHRAPELLDAIHHTNPGFNFCSSRDEYVSCWFTAAEQTLDRSDIRPEVGGYGSQATSLRREENAWHVNFKLPPGLAPGWHEVRLRTKSSPFSNARRIAVDIPAKADSLSITGVCDGRTWTRDQVLVHDEAVVSLWVEGLPENADRNNVRVVLGGVRLAVDYLAGPDGENPRQLNAKVPRFVGTGELALTVAVGETVSAPAMVTLLDDESRPH